MRSTILHFLKGARGGSKEKEFKERDPRLFLTPREVTRAELDRGGCGRLKGSLCATLPPRTASCELLLVRRLALVKSLTVPHGVFSPAARAGDLWCPNSSPPLPVRERNYSSGNRALLWGPHPCETGPPGLGKGPHRGGYEKRKASSRKKP